MRRILLIIAGLFYFVGTCDSRADSTVHMRLVNQALDQIESRRNPPKILSPVAALAPKTDQLEFASEYYWSKFDYPKSYGQKGVMSGYSGKYAHRFSTNPRSIINMFSLQGQWAHGKFKQQPYVGPSGIKDYTFDIRGVVGKDLYFPKVHIRVTPYTGFGYRYLKDNSQGLNTVIDGFELLGLRRYSHYDYLASGWDIVYQSKPVYSIESVLEYDYLYNGWQVSKVGVLPGFSTISIAQKSGAGLRGSLRFNYNFKGMTAFVEAFYRYWYIHQSKGVIENDVPLYEPRNITEEFGFRLGLEI